MLAFLSLTPEGTHRDALAETFWESGKLGSVRQALYELRQLPGADSWLRDDDGVVRVLAETDVAHFANAVSRGDTTEALARYGGELLTGHRDLAAPRYDEWLAANREWISALHLEALVGEAERLESLGEWDAAKGLILAALEVDQLNEALYRMGMRLAYAAGDSTGALWLYRQCVSRLERELGESPSDATRELAGSIGEQASARTGLRTSSSLDLLPAELLRLLQTVALSGGPLGVHGTAAVMGLSDFEVAERMSALEEGGWLDSQLHVSAQRLGAVMGSITPAVKQLLHKRIAEVLAAGPHTDDALVAHHLLGASRARDAAPHLIGAARAAIARAALEEATTHLFMAAWAAFDLPEGRLEAYSLLEGVASQRGDQELQNAALAAAESLALELQDDLQLADVRLRRSRQRLSQGRVGEGLELALDALEIANRIGSRALLAKARNAVGAGHYFAGDLDGASAAFASNLEAEDMIERYRAYSNLASLTAMRGNGEEAYGQFEAALTLARSIGPQADVAATLNNLAATADRLGEYAKAVRHFREGIAVSRRNQAADREGRMLTNLAAVYARQGQLGPAWNTAEEVEELADKIAAPRLRLSAIELKADVQHHCGLLGPALTNLATALEIAGQLEDERKALSLTAHVRTLEALDSGDLSGAVAAISALDEARLTDDAPWLWFELARASRAADEALDLAHRVKLEAWPAHLRIVADIVYLRAALLTGADEACLRLAAEAARRLTGSLATAEIVERPLGLLLLALHAAGSADESVPEYVMDELAEQGAGLPRTLRTELLLQPQVWLASLRR